MTVSNETVANLLSTWAHNLEYLPAASGTVAEMRKLVDELSPKVRIRERIDLTRLWSEDREYIERWNEKNPIVGWMRLIRAEFDGCEVESHHGEVSVIDGLRAVGEEVAQGGGSWEGGREYQRPRAGAPRSQWPWSGAASSGSRRRSGLAELARELLQDGVFHARGRRQLEGLSDGLGVAELGQGLHERGPGLTVPAIQGHRLL